MNDFIPNTKGPAQKVPFFDDVTSGGGWEGQETGKSIETLKSEVTMALSRLGGTVGGFQDGRFGDRDGFRIHYALTGANGKMVAGQLDIAALPLKPKQRNWRSNAHDQRQEKSMKMALFMCRNALNGLWFLQQLSPGFAPLMPWMVDAKTGKTITEMWSESPIMKRLLPSGDGDFIEGEVKDIED